MAALLARLNSLDLFTKGVLGTYVVLSGVYSVVNTEGKKPAPAHEDHHTAHATHDHAHAAEVKAHAAQGHALIVVREEHGHPPAPAGEIRARLILN